MLFPAMCCTRNYHNAPHHDKEDVFGTFSVGYWMKCGKKVRHCGEALTRFVLTDHMLIILLHDGECDSTSETETSEKTANSYHALAARGPFRPTLNFHAFDEPRIN
jgi:hypothetical protein